MLVTLIGENSASESQDTVAWLILGIYNSNKSSLGVSELKYINWSPWSQKSRANSINGKFGIFATYGGQYMGIK